MTKVAVAMSGLTRRSFRKGLKLNIFRKLNYEF